MRSAFISLVLFIILLPEVRAQEGLPFVTDIPFNSSLNSTRITSIVQDAEETMFFSTARGVLEYDGSEWTHIPTSSPVLQIHYHQFSDRLFIGLRSNAFELVKTDSGTYQTLPVPGLDTEQPITHVLSTDKDVFFIGESEVFRYTPLLKQEAEGFKYPEKLISGGFLFEGTLYLLCLNDGLYKWNEGELEPLGDFASMAEDPLIFGLATSRGTLLGFENDNLYFFNGSDFNRVGNEISKFASDNILSGGVMLNDSMMAISTLAGGAAIVNIDKELIRYRFDYTTGIKDNEIFCVGKDRDQGIWLAYESGLSRIDLGQPIKRYSGYPGLEGSLTASIMVNGQLHVATGTGVYVLKAAKSTGEIKRLMNEVIRKKKSADRIRTANYVPPHKTNSGKEDRKSSSLIERYQKDPEAVKKELSRKELRQLKKELRQKKKKQKSEAGPNAFESLFLMNPKPGDQSKSGTGQSSELIPPPSTGTSGSGMSSPPGSGAKHVRPYAKPKNSKNTSAQIAELKALSRSFLFRKVKNIDVKCRQLLNWDGQVLAASNNGVYLIENEHAVNLTPNIYIDNMKLAKDGKSLLLATSDGVSRLWHRSSGWELRSMEDSVRFVAYNVVEDSEGAVWAGTDNGAYRYSEGKSEFFSLPEELNERALVAEVYGKTYLLVASGIYRFVPSENTIVKASLPGVSESGRMEYLLGNDDMVWIRSSSGWNVINADQQIQLLPFLDLFDDIRNLIVAPSGNLYVIDKGQAIYAVQISRLRKETDFNVYIKQVLNADGKPFQLDKLTVSAEENSLYFNISAPFYLKCEATQYQYRVDGLRNNWSRWSKTPQVDIPFLPAGNYTLQVRAKNVLGEVSKISTLAFNIEKPFWLRWYFMLAYGLIVLLMMLAIIKVRERSLKRTQRILEEKVQQRTADLATAKDRAEQLLLNILPKETAEELQKNGKATAKHYNQVSVLFTDFKGFTQFAEHTEPEKLVNELHRFFIRFDDIMEKYGLEKIKTIGDSYMCAGGVPIRNNSNAIATALAGLEIRDFMQEVGLQKKKQNLRPLEIRIGIHTGPLTAGVVGKKKFAYDIWGDTVNIASRMETASEPGRVNISGTTYGLIKKYFECEYRGQKEAKGKGLIEMYFVNRIRSAYSEDPEGTVPNNQLWDIIR